jgi:ABC-type transport system involved in cytochrome bd biosynthesis fused ATPase/permease subunit
MQHAPIDETPEDASGGPRNRLTLAQLFLHSLLDVRRRTRPLQS